MKKSLKSNTIYDDYNEVANLVCGCDNPYCLISVKESDDDDKIIAPNCATPKDEDCTEDVKNRIRDTVLNNY